MTRTKTQIIKSICGRVGARYTEGQKHMRKAQIELVDAALRKKEEYDRSHLISYTFGFIFGAAWIVLAVFVL